MKKLYQDAHNRPPVDLDLAAGPLSASVPPKVSGWTVIFDQDQKVRADFNVHVLSAYMHTVILENLGICLVSKSP